MSAPLNLTLETPKQDRDLWGRLVESAVGANLVNSSRGKNIEVFYWLERNQGVDFVLNARNSVVAIEVKTGRKRERLPGMAAFCKTFKVKRPLLVGSGGIPVDEFLATPIEHWIA
jgi:hypothetical protein